ncbi:MAG TPA: ATP-binding cassette domain-containing protein, partial [Pseudobdellovibrionaceae bacterium]|nr:ATP-binding cassette domain-containing protein [Pseudobdellovibrionaceae bacterium]
TEKKSEETATKGETGSGSLDRITEDEDREIGAVKGSVYLDYFKSLGGEGRWRSWRLAGLLGGAILVRALPLLQRWWLGMISSYQQSGDANGWVAWLIAKGWGDVLNDPLRSIAVYGLIGLSALLFNLMNSLWWLERGIDAGKLMQERMLSSLLKAPLRFFDSTPVGRILQRFSRDVESVDIYLQRSFSEAIHIFIEVILCLLLILTLVPASFALIGPILILYYIIQRDYRLPAREVKRLDSIARSPRYAHFKETLVGLPVIRGFQSEDWFLESFYSKLAHSQRMFYNHVMLNRWFSVRVPMVGGLIAAATSVAIVLGAKSGHLGAGIAGVLTIYMLNFWAYLNWGIRVFADIESRMTSVERMQFYMNLPSETDTRVPRSEELPESWPFRGEVVFESVQARYAPHLPRVLHGVSFKVGAGEKVGLIGRTGSGKSTLFQCLFRFVELESGRILIDGEDIASVPLERLRRSLAIIPQDPTLFLGTIRSNMDRYDEYSEDELEEALRNASLLSFVKSLDGGLDAPVLESGLNLSQGQRQLLCLARALLTKARIIVLDEATASVDVETDAILQRVIRENLRGVTLLIIAHRLGTVADCDKVVDLAFGRVKGEMRSEEARRVLAEIVREEET